MKILKGKYKDCPIFKQCLILFLLCSFGLSISSVLGSTLLILRFGANSVAILQEILIHITDYPEWMKSFQFLQTIGLFIFPSVICSYLFSDNYKKYLQIDTSFCAKLLVWTAVSTIVLVPISNSIHALNQQIVFPKCMNNIEKWMKNQETIKNKIAEQILHVSSPQDLIFNILLLCLFTAIGEEFIFRGVLQNMIGRVVENPYKVIWGTAAIFSAVHLQFYGFLPRLLLGAYFGYLLYYTKNLWISVAAHGTYNLWGVLCTFLSQSYPEILEQTNRIGTGTLWWISAISLFLFPVIWNQIKNAAFSSPT